MSARTTGNDEIAGSLSDRLELATTAIDSLDLLTDIFDLRPKDKRDSIGRMILHTAACSGNDQIGLDIIRNLANLHIRNDSLLFSNFTESLS